MFRSQDLFVVWHGVFELCFIDTFHAKLHLFRFVAFRKFFSAIRFTAKTNHFVAFKFDFKESRGTFTLGCEWGDKPVMLVSFKFFTEFGFNKILHIFCSDSEVVAVRVHFENLKVFAMKVIV